MRTSPRIALTLGLLAITVGEPALAAGHRDESRGAKHPIVRSAPSPPPLEPPVGTKVGGLEKVPPVSVSALASLLRLALTLRF